MAEKVAGVQVVPSLVRPGLAPVKQAGDGGELDVNIRTRNALLRAQCCLGEPGSPSSGSASYKQPRD